jgi:hypothetical protein
MQQVTASGHPETGRRLMFIIDKVLTMLLLPTALMVECTLLGCC